ncbi:MAG: four helix bundle protein [Chthoniobacteraceae bacterium]
MPKDVSGKVLANQLMRSASSVGANYRSACRSRSTAEFLSKLGVVLEEADELCAIFFRAIRMAREAKSSSAPQAKSKAS